MTLFRLTKKQIILRVILLIVFLIAAYIALCIRACPHWEPAAIDPQPTAAKRSSIYIDPDGMTQETRILPPEGYTRVPASEGSFLSYMRRMPVYEEGTPVYTYQGKALSAANAAAVYDLTLGKEGYQECADSIIRLWSEYFYATGQTGRIAFHLTNGFATSYEKWSHGSRILAVGSLSWSLPLKPPEDSAQTLHDYLYTVMRYAGTRSLEAESEPISAADARAGDILCHGGSPGHAVVLADVAENERGERIFLIAQGFQPSQSCHIIGGVTQDDCPWYTTEQLGADTSISLSSYTFHPGELRRWCGGFPE